MNLPSYFAELLSGIEPSPSYREDQQRGHTLLRQRLADDDDFGRVHVNTFLQGSYKRKTAIHPGKDVDIVVVTTLDPDATPPAEATARLRKCLAKYYPGRVTPQNRSLNVELSYVTMDVVVAGSRQLRRHAALADVARLVDLEARSASWKDQPLQIPDRELASWVDTHPKRQLEWTSALNQQSDGFFVPLVKLFKWWRKETYISPEYPKGYPLERLVGEAFDSSQRGDAEGFVALLWSIVQRFDLYAQLGTVPHLADPGVPSHNVLARVSGADFRTLLAHVKNALPVAQAALAANGKDESVQLWRKLFGPKFPEAAPGKAAFPAVAVRPPNRPEGFA